MADLRLQQHAAAVVVVWAAPPSTQRRSRWTSGQVLAVATVALRRAEREGLCRDR